MEATKLERLSPETTYKLGHLAKQNTGLYEEASESGWSPRAQPARISEALSRQGETVFILRDRQLRRDRVAPLPDRQKVVRLEVIEVEPGSVLCQAMLPGRPAEVAFAPHMFPNQPLPGNSYNLSIDSVDGVRRPRIVVAEPASTAFAEEKAQIEALIRSIE